MKFRKSIGMLLSASLLVGQVPLKHTQGSIPQGYWQYQEPFVTAKENGDYGTLIEVSKNIEALMLQEAPNYDRTSILYNVYSALAEAYEAILDYENAIYYLECLIPYAEEMGYTDTVIIAKKGIIKLNPMTEVYALTSNVWQLPYYGAKYEPQAGAYFGRAREAASVPVMEQESATSFYVECLQEEISQYDYLISPLDDGQRLLQICLNMPEEASTLAQVTTSSADGYIIRNMEYLATLQSPVLLRIGGEMNVFSDLPSPELFKEAYIKIANYARQYAPNVALVFSPNDISHWGENIEDYYPGDGYVDWVGMSTYTRKYLDASNPEGSSAASEMFYGTGDYSSPIHALTEIVELFGDRKPILISESGAGYAHKSETLNLWTYSSSQLQTLFTYANMVYPQVKTIINFDANVDSDEYYFSMSANSDLLEMYQNTITNNPTLLTQFGEQASTAYIKAEDYSDNLPTITLSAFSAPVGQGDMTVVYEVDGDFVGRYTKIPYTHQVQTSSLSQGQHSLKVTFTGNNGFVDEKNYILNKSGENTVSIVEGVLTTEPNTTPQIPPTPDNNQDSGNTGASGFSDVPESHWAYPYVSYVVGKGYMSGSNGLFRPAEAANRGETAQTLANFSGEYQDPSYAAVFSDVEGSGYEGAIGWCVNQLVMNGIGDGKFGTYDNLTREQFAVTLAAYALKSGIYTAPSDEDMVYLLGFQDNLAISSWAKSAMAWAVANDLMAGFDGYLNPKGSLTLAEIAAMMYRYDVTFF